MAGTIEVLSPPARVRPERLAWGILLASFALFCVICAASTLGVHYFFFRSTVPMQSVVQVGRGTLTLTTRADPIEQSVRGERVLFNQARVFTDGQSQAVLTFRDPEDDGRLIAAVTVKRNASINFDSALQGRFDWSTPAYFYDIALGELSGEVDVFVSEGLSRDFRLTLSRSDGSWASLLQSGHYIVNATATQFAVVNRTGQAVVVAGDHQPGHSIPEATQAIYVDGASDIVLSPAYADLLENSSFEDTQPPADNGSSEDSQILPTAWGCTNLGEMPRGEYRSEVLDGRRALRLVRAENASTHGETRCVQVFAPDGLDVTGFTSLTLRATFYVKYQSLSGCGQDASECPLMLYLKYRDVNGNPQDWHHGFYSQTDPAYSDWPLQCDTCAQQHESIYSSAWYTYNDNLFTLFSPDKRPAHMDEIWFYASGHQFDVFVSEVSLLAGQTEVDAQG